MKNSNGEQLLVVLIGIYFAIRIGIVVGAVMAWLPLLIYSWRWWFG